jgi:hypothetical protein
MKLLVRFFSIAFVWSQSAAVSAAEQRNVMGMTVGFSSQADGSGDQPYLGPGFGGTSVAGICSVDHVVTDRLSLGAEASLDTGMTGRQRQMTQDGINVLTSRHRDEVFSGMAKVAIVRVERAQLSAALGAGLGWRHTIREGTFQSVARLPVQTGPLPRQILSNVVFAGTVGLDGAIFISERTGFAFNWRLHALADDDRDSTGRVRRGVSPILGRFAGGVRLMF